MALTDISHPTDIAMLTDLYELTMAQGLWESGKANEQGCFTAFYRDHPFGSAYAVMCGTAELPELVENLRFTSEDIEYLAGKLVRLRIFDDEAGVMNLDVVQTGGEILVVSQFTLQASTRKGNRPSYIKAAPEAVSRPLYERFTARVAELLGRGVATGEFGADMQVELVNDGPVTIWMDSKNKE